MGTLPGVATGHHGQAHQISSTADTHDETYTLAIGMQGMRTHRRGRQSGLTLMELLVTIIIAGIAFAALVPVVVQALQAGHGDRARALALSVAQDRIEKIRELGYEELATTKLQDPAFHFGLFGPTSNVPDGTTDRVFDVAYVVKEIPVSQTDTRIAYKTVTVTVNWRGAPYPHKSVSLSTVVYR